MYASFKTEIKKIEKFILSKIIIIKNTFPLPQSKYILKIITVT